MAVAPQAAEAIAGTKVIAPLLGTFYSTPKPGDAAFVKIGDRVTADTVVCIVEVMKLMNSVTAGVAGVIAAVHVRDGDLVEHGQPLFTVVEAT
jgi:acetyl-CoA carboxylase biotin carboxyl carrier protein